MFLCFVFFLWEIQIWKLCVWKALTDNSTVIMMWGCDVPQVTVMTLGCRRLCVRTRPVRVRWSTSILSTHGHRTTRRRSANTRRGLIRRSCALLCGVSPAEPLIASWFLNEKTESNTSQTKGAKGLCLDMPLHINAFISYTCQTLFGLVVHWWHDTASLN